MDDIGDLPKRNVKLLGCKLKRFRCFDEVLKCIHVKQCFEFCNDQDLLILALIMSP